jgi:hypothetical protein
MVSDRLRPSATNPGTSGLVPKYRPPFSDCTRTRMATSSTFARCTCRFTILSGMRNDYIKLCIDRWAGSLGCVELAGTALFTVFVKGAGFSSIRNIQ